MDDGFLNVNDNTINLCTDNFTKSEIEYLVFILINKFNIPCNINRRKYYNKNNNEIVNYRIRLTIKGSYDFINIINPYIIPCMLYKMPRKEVSCPSHKCGKGLINIK
jgi:hypothetical protein